MSNTPTLIVDAHPSAPRQTVRATWARYLGQQLARIRHFNEARDFERELAIQDALANYVRTHGPSGSGIDQGTELDIGLSAHDRLIFNTAFHHMDDHGHYDGWTIHVVTARPSFALDMTVVVHGRNRNMIKDYLGDVFSTWLLAEADHPALVERA